MIDSHYRADCRILHVDDNEDDSILFQRALQLLDFQGRYDWVPSIHEALSRLASFPIPNVVVTDGYRLSPEFLQKIQETVFPKAIPVVVYSADADPLVIDQAVANGACGYLLKKNSFEESIIAVGRILELCD